MKPRAQYGVLRIVYSVADLAVVMGLSEWSVRQEISAGRLVARRPRGDLLILEEDRKAWLAGLPRVSAATTAATDADQTASAQPAPTPITDAPAKPGRRTVVRRFDIYREGAK